MALTAKRQAFVLEYLIDSNATQAAIRAGYSAASAKVEGCRLLTNADVLAELAKQRSIKVERTGITADWVLMQQASLHAQTVGDQPEVARKTLRDIGDGIGMYVEKTEHRFPDLTPEDRTNRVAALLSSAKQRATATNGNGKH